MSDNSTKETDKRRNTTVFSLKTSDWIYFNESVYWPEWDLSLIYPMMSTFFFSVLAEKVHEKLRRNKIKDTFC